MFELAKGHWRAGLALHALTPLAVVMLLAAVFEVPGRGRLWPVAMAAFAAYGAGRILFPAWAGVA